MVSELLTIIIRTTKLIIITDVGKMSTEKPTSVVIGAEAPYDRSEGKSKCDINRLSKIF
jgi:hypothetical protein